MSLIRLENVSKFYKSVETVSVGMQKVNLEFNIGEFVAVTGESGSGKSTLLNVISGLDGYEEGELYLFDEETSHYNILDWEKYRSAYVGFVFQNYNIIDSYTVYQNVLLALEVQGYNPEKRKDRALQLIRQVGLESHKNHKASKLSGGQKQRTVIARALAKDCPIIVADEPTGNLDSTSAEQIMELLNNISKDKLVIVVTHDYDQVKEYATRKIKMHDGEVVEDKVFNPVDETTKIKEPKIAKMEFWTVIKFAVRNLISTPKKTLLILFMQLIIMLAFMLIYSSTQYDMLNYSYYNSSTTAQNVPETRMLVEKRDGTDLTQDDYDYLSSIAGVNRLYENGINFYNDYDLYVFDLDNPNTYTYTYNIDGTSSISYYYYNMSISATDSASSLGIFDYTGTMPVEANEVIVENPQGDISIGDEIILSSSNNIYGEENIADATIETFIVTGLKTNADTSSYNSGTIYFSDAFLEGEQISRTSYDSDKMDYISNSVYEGSFVYDTNIFYVWNSYNYDDGTTDTYKMSYDIPADTSDDPFSGTVTDTVSITFSYSLYVYWLLDDISYDVYYGYYYEDSIITLNITIDNIDVYGTPSSSSTSYYNFVLNQNLYDAIEAEMLAQTESYYTVVARDVASLSISSLSSGERILNMIDSETYRVFYPANIPAPTTLETLLLSTFYNFTMVVFTLLLYLIVHAVMKNMMLSRNKDFAIYRSIGAQKSFLAQSVMLEQVFIAISSALLMFATIHIMAYYIPTIAQYLSVLTFKNYLYLSIIFILFGAFLGHRFNKKLFKQSVIQTINMSREVE